MYGTMSGKRLAAEYNTLTEHRLNTVQVIHYIMFHAGLTSMSFIRRNRSYI